MSEYLNTEDSDNETQGSNPSLPYTKEQISEATKAAESLKVEGNAKFSEGDFDSAISHYSVNIITISLNWKGYNLDA